MANDRRDIEEISALYADFARRMVSAVKRRIEAGEVKTSPRMVTQFNNGDVRNRIEPSYRLDRQLPYPQDGDYPRQVADECAHWFFDHDLLKTKVSNAAGQEVNATFPMLRDHICLEMVGPLRKILSEQEHTQVSARRLLSVFRRHLRYWSHQEPSSDRFMPIYSLRLPVRRIALADLGYIAALPDHLKGAFWNRLPLANHVSIAMFADAQYALYFAGSLLESHRQVERNESGAAVLTALRLCKSGKVGTVGICSLARTSGISTAGFSPFPDAGIYSVFGFADEEFHITGTDLTRFRRIFKQLADQDFRIWKSLRIPLGRLNRTYLRASPEDVIIDLSICLEVLLLPNDRIELSYRLSVRGAKLLSSILNPTEVQSALKKLYDARSKIVHEGKSLNRTGIDSNSARFVEDARELVRKIFIEIITRMVPGKTLKSICDDLDRAVIASLA